MSELAYRDFDHALAEYDQVVDTQPPLPSDAEAIGLMQPHTASVEIDQTSRDDTALRDQRPIENVTLTNNALRNDGDIEIHSVPHARDADPTINDHGSVREAGVGVQALRFTATDHSTPEDNPLPGTETDTSESGMSPDDPKQKVATEFRRIIEQHGHDTDSGIRQIFDLTLSGRDTPDAIRMRTIRSSADGSHVVMGDPPSAAEAMKFASTPGVMVAGSGSITVDRLDQYRGLSDEQILNRMGVVPDSATLTQLSTALSECERIERPTRIKLPTEEERAAYNFERANRIRLINSAAAEAADQPYRATTKAGPYHDDFKDILARADRKLAEISATTGIKLTSENLVPESYQSKDAKSRNDELYRYRDGRRALADIIWERRALIRGLVRDKLDMADQKIPDGLFTEPKYLQMGGNHQACFNACFRMVCGDITGQSLSEHEVVKALESTHGASLVDDDVYMKMLESKAVEEASGHSVRSVGFIGADLEYVSKLASIVKDKRPDAKVYSIVSLETESGGNSDIWHTNILLGADKDYVYCHDPTSTVYGAPNRQIYKEDFVRRWATTHNRGYVVFALPKNRQAQAAA